jgi:PAS domain S-box-containing protein
MADESKSHRVLVVEDEGLIAHDIAARLQTLGHTVVDTVSTADQAVAAAPRADVILMDIRIDGPRDGIEAAHEIRDRYHVPVIFLTAHADRSTLDRAKISGPSAYLVKPLSTNALQSAIEIAVYRHRMERALEEQEAWLRTTLRSVADSTIVTDSEGRIRTINRAAEQVTGWRADEAAGQPYGDVLKLISASTEPLEPVELALLLDQPVELPRQWRLVTRTGRELTIEGSAAPVRDAHGVFGAVVTFRDVTARRWQDRHLRQAQRMDTAARLAASVSEEYTNLIAIIRTQADHLLAHFGEYSPLKRPIEEIRAAAAAATQITRRLGSFGTRPSVLPETFSMNSLLRRMSKLLESVAGDRIKVLIRLDPPSGRVKGDLAQIEQAVMNLMLQASGRLPSGGEIVIETNHMENPVDGQSYVSLALTYDASEPDLEQLFEPIAAEAHGLALPVAHAIIRDHSGFLTAQPSANGGTRLEILLPRVAEASLNDPATAGAAPNILLVDSHDAVRSQLHNFFEARGLNLLESADAAEAIALGQMHEGSLDVLIAGEAAAEEIRKAIEGSHPSLALLRIVERAEQSPDEVRRPFSQQVLFEKVTGLLARNPRAHPASMGK